MNNIVTFETAKHLKESGFPQPEPALGQFWYNRSGTPYIMSHRIDPESSLIVKSLHGGCWSHMYEMKRNGGFVFAPTATDILRELGKDYELSFFEESWFVCEDSFAPCTEHENPAEACALAWLKLHEK